MKASDPVIIAVISTIGGIIIAYITNVVSQKVQAKKAAGQPKDRMEQMFDGYERLIKQKDIEDDRKAKAIKRLEGQVYELETQLETTKTTLSTTKEELRVSKDENRELREMLDAMRAEYKKHKIPTPVE